MQPSTIVLGVLLLALPAARANDPEPPDPRAKGKPNGPLMVRLVAKKTAYVLDRGGLSAAQYREAVKEGKVKPPAVELVLELKNTSKEEVKVRVAGAVPELKWKLTGPKGAVVARTGNIKANDKPPRLNTVTLKPGEKYEIAIAALDSSAVSRPKGAVHWTEPGTYTLSAELVTTGTGLAGKAGWVMKAGGAKVPVASTARATLTSQEVKLTVTEKK